MILEFAHHGVTVPNNAHVWLARAQIEFIVSRDAVEYYHKYDNRS